MRHGVPEIGMNDNFNFSAMAHLPKRFGSGKCEWKIKTNNTPSSRALADWRLELEN